MPIDYGFSRIEPDEGSEEWDSVGDWIRNVCAPGEAFIPPPDPRQLPLVPLNVRIFASEQSSEALREEALVDFALARDFWVLWACIDLRLIKGSVEVVKDPDSTLWNPAADRSPLDALHTPNQNWVSIVYINDTKQVGDGNWAPRASKGATYFKIPATDAAGYGLIMCMNSANVLAHELGHALGLSHVPLGYDADTDAEVFGMRASTYCLQPFPNDLADLSECLQRANLMNGRAAGSFPNLSARWLSYSQADRARLTITSRKCYYAHVEIGLDSMGSVLLDDIPAPFLAETFMTDRHPDLMPPTGTLDPPSTKKSRKPAPGTW